MNKLVLNCVSRYKATDHGCTSYCSGLFIALNPTQSLEALPHIWMIILLKQRQQQLLISLYSKSRIDSNPKRGVDARLNILSMAKNGSRIRIFLNPAQTYVHWPLMYVTRSPMPLHTSYMLTIIYTCVPIQNTMAHDQRVCTLLAVRDLLMINKTLASATTF